MKNLSLKALSRNAIILACIIVVARSLIYWAVFLQWPTVTTVIYFIFPNEVLGFLQDLLFVRAGFFLRNFPVFSFLLPVTMILSAVLLLKKGKALPLILCYCCLILSILISIPGMIGGYYYMLEQYNEYAVNPPAVQNGILGLMDSFAITSRPSLALLVVEIVILVVYAVWSGWQVRGLYTLGKRLR